MAQGSQEQAVLRDTEKDTFINTVACFQNNLKNQQKQRQK
jgi:hypothetical protein